MTATSARSDVNGRSEVAPVAPLRGMSPWVPTAVIMAGTIMVILDTTIVNVALHAIGVDLGAGDGIEWVVSIYLLGVCASQPATGWLADRFGRRSVFLTSLGLFTGASMLCALAPTLGLLIVARGLQGLGGGALMPVGMAMVLDLFPKSKHGRAIATWGMAAMVAPAIGPTLGGWLVTAVSWHWLFLINVPIGIVCVALGLRLIPDSGLRHLRPFDRLGLLLGSGGLAVTVLGLSQGNQWGWQSPATLTCIAIGIGSLFAFVRHELRSEHPLLQLRMFEQRTFAISMAVMFFVTFAQFGRLVFVALELESLRNYTPFRVGVLFLPAAIVTAGAMQVGGLLVDRVGPRLPIMMGCIAMLGGVVGLGSLQLTTSVTVIIGFLTLQGIGMGLINAPAMVAGLSELPAHLLAQGTAVRSLCSQVSGAFAVALLGAVVAARMGENPTPEQSQLSYNTAFLVAGAGVALALILASRLPKRTAVTDPEMERELELEALALAE
jgi:EmrB/QacA subfamily drug resistance transporter